MAEPDFEKLLLEALELPPGDRSDYLSRSCGDNPELRAEIEAMLKALAAADRWLETLNRKLDRSLPARRDDASSSAGDPRPPADRVGSWKLVKRIGFGGMGSVWLAERSDGSFEQKVAIKFLSAGGASPALIRRFEAERRILARLDHPNVARLLDGGVTERGVPWLAMELVEGEPIDSWCDGRGLPVRSRIELFLQVCEGVQHAHRRLVVHRDLKPSNILVDVKGSVKLLDFGIAKVLDQDAEEPGAPTLLTRLGGSPLTPAFASPEQLRGAAVTTASDVYALGALLYLLLCGRLPHETAGRSISDLAEAAASQLPAPPSAALQRNADGSAEKPGRDTARLRGATPERLARALRGDLDTIVLKAMRPEPERRYASVEQLAGDLENWRAGMPISARPDSPVYRVRKFVRRHPSGVAAAVALPILTIGGLLLHVDRLEEERDRARMAAEKAEQITAFLTNLFESADPAEARGEEITAGELLERGAERIDAFEGDARVQADLLRTLARVRRSLGSYGEAEQLLRKAVALRRESDGAESPEVAEAMAELGLALSDLGRFEEAEETLNRAHDIARAERPESALHANVLGNLASVLSQRGRYEEAAALSGENVELRRRLFGERSPQFATAENSLGAYLRELGQFAEAEERFSRALSIRRELLGEDHPDTLSSLSNVASAATAAGDYDRAVELYAEVISLRERILGESHPDLATSLFQQGVALRLAGRLEEAEEVWRRSLEIRRVALGPNHPSTASALNALAAVAYDRDNFDASAGLLEEALGIHRIAYGDRHPSTVALLGNLGNLRWMQGRKEEAERLYVEVLNLREELLGPDHPDVASSLHDLAGLYRDSGRPFEGAAAAERALEILTAVHSLDHPRVQQVRELLEELDSDGMGP